MPGSTEAALAVKSRTGNLPRPFYDRAKERLTQDEEERIRLSAAESL
jgi:hypothetical protein